MRTKKITNEVIVINWLLARSQSSITRFFTHEFEDEIKDFAFKCYSKMVNVTSMSRVFRQLRQNIEIEGSALIIDYQGLKIKLTPLKTKSIEDCWNVERIRPKITLAPNDSAISLEL